MKSASPAAGIALVDDGELEEVARVLEAGGLTFDRYRGGQIPERIEAPRDLLIVTSRRLEHVAARPVPSNTPGEPLRIVAVADDSPALRRRLRRQGMHLLVRLPASRETWRLLIARALHQGDERRVDTRVVPEVAVDVDVDAARADATLLDLSNRGCRIQTRAILAVGDPIRFTVPGESLPGDQREPLELHGRIRRLAQRDGSPRRTYAVVFDPDLSRATRQRLTTVINQWASGRVEGPLDGLSEPAIPACRLPSLPDLMLDDETDPPIRAAGDVSIALARSASESESTAAAGNGRDERRSGSRGAFPAVVRAKAEDRALALVGRDLSARGMRIERHPDLELGDRFRLALHGPTLGRPLTLDAVVVRDDADQGLALAFLGVSRETAALLEKLVACLPDVESLEAGELAGLGTVVSEIVRD